MAHLSRLLRATARPASDGVVVAGRADDLDRDGLGRALGVGEELAGQVGADVGDGAGELVFGRGDPGRAAGEQQDRVVGGHAAVGVDPVEGQLGGTPQHPVEGGGVGLGVGGDHAEHRGEGRGEHARALGHAADRVAGVRPAKGDLGDGVGGADRVGGGQPAVAGQLPRGGADPGQQLGHRQPVADQAGRADRDLGRGPAEHVGGLLRGLVGVLEAGRAGAGVGAAGVEHDRGDPAAAQDLLGPQHRRGLHPVAREHPGRGVGRAVVDDQGEVTPAAALDAGGESGGPEAEGGGDAHGATPIVVSPRSSGRPRARLALWTAPPAVPLVRLSMAATAMTRPARSSRATWTAATLAPSRHAVAGHSPSGSSRTNRSSE